MIHYANGKFLDSKDNEVRVAEDKAKHLTVVGKQQADSTMGE